MGADKALLNAQGMWYSSDDQDPISLAHLRERAATVMPSMKGASSQAGKQGRPQVVASAETGRR